MENKTPNPNPNKPNSKFPKFNISWIYGIIIFVLLGSYFFNENTPVKEVKYSTFKEYVKKGMIEKIDVYSTKNSLEAQVIKDSLKNVFGKDSELYAKERMINVSVPAEEFSRFIQVAEEKYGFKGSVEYKESRNYIDVFLYSILPFLLLILFFVFMNRRMSGQMGGGGGGGIFNVG
ncbi:MAG: ATP-dependent metallopeptidase FtsH/Yme1/Tma family protein, partial [Paludibacter sp.]